MKTYRSREVTYADIKHRALALLQAGEIDGKAFDEIRHSESCTRSHCISTAIDRACREIEQQFPPPHHHLCVTMRKSDFRKAESEIKRHLRDWNNDKELTENP